MRPYSRACCCAMHTHASKRELTHDKPVHTCFFKIFHGCTWFLSRHGKRPSKLPVIALGPITWEEERGREDGL